MEEKVVIKDKVFVDVRLGNVVEIPMLVANINDSCTLGIDFLKKFIWKIFLNLFWKTEKKRLRDLKKNEIKCGRLEGSLDVQSNLKCLFEKSSRNLNKSQKQLCAKLLNEFRDVFSEEIIAGNCWDGGICN